MHSPDPNYREVVESGFREAAFLSDLGISLSDFGPGWCESSLRVAPRHLQHIAAIPAAMSLTPAHEFILTVEFKIHPLRAGSGESLVRRVQVFKPSKAFHVVESEVFALADGKQTLVCKLTGTTAVLSRSEYAH